MNDAGKQHKRAWEYDAYNFWVKHNGTPEVRAKEDVENPTKMLRMHIALANGRFCGAKRPDCGAKTARMRH